MKPKFLYWLMALLGFSSMSSCDKIIDGGRPEYGSPHATFTLRGRVTDAQGYSIHGIKIDYNGVNNFGTPMVEYGITNRSGEYQIRFYLDGAEELSADVSAIDVDGMENRGLFKTQTKQVSVSGDDYVDGDGNWNMGDATKEVNFILELDDTQPQE
jgi:putative lipoprotein (rSAM/lipoprotein system)